MAIMTLKNIPDDLYEELKKMPGEIIAV